MLKLIAIVGTNSKRSTNRQLLQYMQKHFADKAEIELVEIKAIPVFNKPADKQVPAEILEIAAKIEEADGVIIGTPATINHITVSSWNLSAATSNSNLN